MLRSYSAVGRDRWSCVLESLVRLSRMVGLIWACAFPYGDLDGRRRNVENGERSRRRRGRALLRERIGFAMFSAGSTLGQKVEAALWLAGQVVWPRDRSYARKPLSQAASSGSGTAAAPDCAKETRLPGLSSFDSRRECALRGEGDSGTTKTCQTPIYGLASRVAA